MSLKTVGLYAIAGLLGIGALIVLGFGGTVLQQTQKYKSEPLGLCYATLNSTNSSLSSPPDSGNSSSSGATGAADADLSSLTYQLHDGGHSVTVTDVEAIVTSNLTVPVTLVYPAHYSGSLNKKSQAEVQGILEKLAAGQGVPCNILHLKVVNGGQEVDLNESETGNTTQGTSYTAVSGYPDTKSWKAGVGIAAGLLGAYAILLLVALAKVIKAGRLGMTPRGEGPTSTSGDPVETEGIALASARVPALTSLPSEPKTQPPSPTSPESPKAVRKPLSRAPSPVSPSSKGSGSSGDSPSGSGGVSAAKGKTSPFASMVAARLREAQQNRQPQESDLEEAERS